MNFLQSFLNFIDTERLFTKNDQLLIALSGGVDSVVLCEVCRQAGFVFAVAHCNFQLRGEESMRDEKFAKAVAAKYQVPFYLKRFDTANYAEENKVSIQVAARELRYQWFDKIVKGSEVTFVDRLRKEKGENPGIKATPLTVSLSPSSLNFQQSSPVNEPGGPHEEPQTVSQQPSALKLQPLSQGEESSAESNPRVLLQNSLKTYVVTAHHSDDNVETVLMNFFRGTGIAGLHGILPKQKAVVRPLLFATKEQIRDFATLHALEYVEDSSNALDKYTRNYFRNQLLPGLQNIFPQVQQNILNNTKRFREIEILYRQSVDQQIKKLVEINGNERHIPVLKLLKTPALATMVYEIVKDCNFQANQTGEVIKLLQSETGKYVDSATHKAIRSRGWLIITPKITTLSNNVLVEKSNGEVVFAEGRLRFETVPFTRVSITADVDTAFIDASKVVFPLLLRRWKTGDYFYPLGMPKKKKVGKFLSDAKTSAEAKAKVWVIEMNNKIVWVVGKRIDERFKIVPSTSTILKITLIV